MSMQHIDDLGALHDLVSEETGGGSDRERGRNSSHKQLSQSREGERTNRDDEGEDMDDFLERLVRPQSTTTSSGSSRPHVRENASSQARPVHPHPTVEEEDDLEALLDAQEELIDSSLVNEGEKEGEGEVSPRVEKEDKTRDRPEVPPLFGRAAAEAARNRPRTADPSVNTKTGGGSHQHLGSDRMTALEQENARLRGEMSAFDPEFFEQLEDLKFRYSRLQEIVGESPSAGGRGRDNSSPALLSTHDRGESEHDYLKSVSKGRGSLPLDGLSWSVRNSMTAMDRAGLASPLVNRSRASHAHTYAPGSDYRQMERVEGSDMGLRESADFDRGDEFLRGSVSHRPVNGLSLSHSRGATLQVSDTL
jgi:hypothetical protein